MPTIRKTSQASKAKAVSTTERKKSKRPDRKKSAAKSSSTAKAGYFNWKPLFAEFDTDHNGALDQFEFQAAIRVRMAVPEAELPSQSLIDVFNMVDTDRSGALDIDEFLSWLHGRDGQGKQQQSNSIRRKMKRVFFKVANQMMANQFEEAGAITYVCESDLHNIRQGPGRDFDVVSTISIGDPVSVFEKRGDWCRITKEETGPRVQWTMWRSGSDVYLTEMEDVPIAEEVRPIAEETVDTYGWTNEFDGTPENVIEIVTSPTAAKILAQESAGAEEEKCQTCETQCLIM